MMSSLKFSYWSSPQISTTSGANSSSRRRASRNPAMSASRWRPAAASPWSSPYSRRIGSGQPSGRRWRSGRSGSWSTRLRMRAMFSSCPASGGECVTPRPRIAPMVTLLLVCALPRCDTARHEYAERWYHRAPIKESRHDQLPASPSRLPPLLWSDAPVEGRPGRGPPRMPARFREKAPRTTKLPDGGAAILVEGHPPYPAPFLDLRAGRTNETWEPIGVTVDDTAGVGPPEQRLREQDMDALHAEGLFPNLQVGPRLWSTLADPDVYRATVRAYNDWLGEEYCPVAPDRLIGLGVIPWTNVDDAVAELEHCAELGLKGVNLGVFPSGKAYPTAADDRFWAAAVDMKMPLTVHVGFDRLGPRASQPTFEYPGAD